ncbi:FAS1-like dehydratase domain-containing protein [Spirillospora sp. CA-142024]|uniref:FAS1-like dehydratase domain-containing protein n=1 Tax=Spirillospora sp. CA-142024 TaxID=3240036 RepID=UPI003D9287D5
MPVIRLPVEPGHILTFARAIGDDDPAYLAALAGPHPRAVAPPTFVMSSAHFDDDYPLRPRPGEEWFGSGAGPGTAREGGGGLHAEQHFEYHRPVRAGDVLTAETRPGRGWEKKGRAGLLRFTETITEYRDAEGRLVVTARSVGVVTEAPVSGPSARGGREES